MKNLRIHIPPFKDQPHLVWALGFVVVIVLLLTCLSTFVYYKAGFYKFDLSRPGFEAERSTVNDDGPKTYDTTSPISVESLQEFLQEFDQRTERLKSYSNFSDQSLSDEEILLKDKQ